MGLKKADESSQSTQYGAMATFWDANTTLPQAAHS